MQLHNYIYKFAILVCVNTQDHTLRIHVFRTQHIKDIYLFGLALIGLTLN